MSNPQIKPDTDLIGAPFFFFTNNHASELLYVSPSVHQVMGYTPAEILGQKYADLVDHNHPLNRDLDLHHRNRSLGSGVGICLRVVSAKSGQRKVLKLQTFGGDNSLGKVVVSHALAQDVSEEYRMEREALTRMRHLEELEKGILEKGILPFWGTGTIFWGHFLGDRQ